MTSLNGFTAYSYYEFRMLIIRSIIVLVAAALRFFCKLSKKEQRIGWDDFWFLLALCLNYVSEGLTFWGNANPLAIRSG